MYILKNEVKGYRRRLQENCALWNEMKKKMKQVPKHILAKEVKSYSVLLRTMRSKVVVQFMLENEAKVYWHFLKTEVKGSILTGRHYLKYSKATSTKVPNRQKRVLELDFKVIKIVYHFISSIPTR